MPTELLPPPPAIDPRAPMIARTDRIVIERPAPALFDWNMAQKLEDNLPATGALPGVVGTTQLTPGPWGVPGARRIVHLSDGAGATEQVLEMIPGERFRYQVWDYTTAAARPIAYAIGEFRYVALDAGRTEVVWTYAFRLRADRFPGFLGPLGRWLLKAAFLDRAYAVLMRETLKTMKAGAERAL
ncbi:SRPBCC family protein [Phenylobacterium sp.]|uniref:SRPBCC family protein n=1 Tax=Phenylobacterium sp. TaxID=1871053 RepID=UPI0026248D33|nr:SRPBCC family protein [Phenylobacterium sp.]